MGGRKEGREGERKRERERRLSEWVGGDGVGGGSGGVIRDLG